MGERARRTPIPTVVHATVCGDLCLFKAPFTLTQVILSIFTNAKKWQPSVESIYHTFILFALCWKKNISQDFDGIFPARSRACSILRMFVRVYIRNLEVIAHAVAEICAAVIIARYSSAKVVERAPILTRSFTRVESARCVRAMIQSSNTIRNRRVLYLCVSGWSYIFLRSYNGN